MKVKTLKIVENFKKKCGRNSMEITFACSNSRGKKIVFTRVFQKGKYIISFAIFRTDV